MPSPSAESVAQTRKSAAKRERIDDTDSQISVQTNLTPSLMPSMRPPHCSVPESVVALVVETANRYPGRVALEDSSRASGREQQDGSGRSISYAELNARSDELARRLRSLGVHAEDVVALRFDRSIAFAVAALAALKAGAAYLPLNPRSPASQTDFQLRDAQARVIVADARSPKGHNFGGCTVILLGEDGSLSDAGAAPGFVSGDSAAPTFAGAADSVAYIIYTSGSTGKPKGVEVTHSNLLNLVRWHEEAFALTPADRMSLLASVEFDASVWEIWPALCAGASIHIPDEMTRQDPEALRDWLVAREATISFVPTPMAEQLISLPWPKSMRLRTLLTGGDTLHVRPRPLLPFRVVNNYGPTECAVVATSGPVAASDDAGELPSIGRPIANVTIHILDETLQPVAAGEAGEICIGGAGVARGYRNQAELTREKFVPDPFSRNAGARLYRSGDLGRRLPNGEIAFLGRIDTQVKIRGFRIELDAIASVLNQLPGVRQSAVVARDYGAGDKRLIAYIVRNAGAPLTHAELREHLAARLPEHMTPAIFVAVDGLPLNANGKVDRAALPEPSDSNRLAANSYIEPRTATEQRLADLLAPLLGVERVSIEDNFFMLGGHSLLGTQLIARMRGAFGIEMGLRTLFECPTVAGLASEVDRLVLKGATRAGQGVVNSKIRLHN